MIIPVRIQMSFLLGWIQKDSWKINCSFWLNYWIRNSSFAKVTRMFRIQWKILTVFCFISGIFEPYLKSCRLIKQWCHSCWSWSLNHWLSILWSLIYWKNSFKLQLTRFVKTRKYIVTKSCKARIWAEISH